MQTKGGANGRSPVLRLPSASAFDCRWSLVFGFWSLVFGLIFVSGCGGGGGNPQPAEATGTIVAVVVLTEPAGISDFSGVSVSVSGASNTYTATTGVDGRATFAGLIITDTTKGTTYSVVGTKTDYMTANKSVVLLKDGDNYPADLKLDYSASKIMIQAWSSFTSGSCCYASALDDFKKAVSRAVTAQEKTDSNTGLGWTYLLGFALSDPTKYQTAIDSFTNARASDADPSNPDAKVGEMFARVDRQVSTSFISDLNQVITLGGEVLLSKPSYQFSHATQFDYVDLHATLAYAYSQRYNSSGGVADDQTKACTHAKSVPSSYSNCATVCAAIATSGSCTSVPCCP